MVANKSLWLSIAFGLLTVMSILLTLPLLVELYDASYTYGYITIVGLPLLAVFSISGLSSVLKKDTGKHKAFLKICFWLHIVLLSLFILIILAPFLLWIRP